MYTTTLVKWGNSQAFRLSKSLCEQAGITTGDTLQAEITDSGSILLSPAPKYRRQRQVTIDELFAGHNGNQQSGEADWGADVGAEVVS